jgi:hypothetical protein
MQGFAKHNLMAGNTMKKALFALALVVSTASTAVLAEEIERYALERTAGGYVRTNVATGETSVCTEKGDQLICRLAADDRQAYEADISKLQAKIDSLEKRVAALESTGVPQVKPPEPAQEEQEFQTSLNRMEQFFRRFMGIVKEFQVFGGDPAPLPDRT